MSRWGCTAQWIRRTPTARLELGGARAVEVGCSGGRTLQAEKRNPCGCLRDDRDLVGRGRSEPAAASDRRAGACGVSRDAAPERGDVHRASLSTGGRRPPVTVRPLSIAPLPSPSPVWCPAAPGGDGDGAQLTLLPHDHRGWTAEVAGHRERVGNPVQAGRAGIHQPGRPTRSGYSRARPAHCAAERQRPAGWAERAAASREQRPPTRGGGCRRGQVCAASPPQGQLRADRDGLRASTCTYGRCTLAPAAIDRRVGPGTGQHCAHPDIPGDSPRLAPDARSADDKNTDTAATSVDRRA